MQRSAAQYTLSSADTPQRAFKFHETAALRFSNPVSGTNDGALYLWTDHGRPQAILKFYTSSHKAYTHVWLSLSENNFVAERDGQVVWSPTEPGIKLLEIQDAPEPAETAAKRLRQMRTLSAEFSATYTATHLTRTAVRVEAPDSAAPPVRNGRRLPRGRGAVRVRSKHGAGRVTPVRVPSDRGRPPLALRLLQPDRGTMTARYRDKEVFFLDRNNTARDPKQPFVMFHALPVPP